MLEKEVVKLQRRLNLVDEQGVTVIDTAPVSSSSDGSDGSSGSATIAQAQAQAQAQAPDSTSPQLPFINDTFHYYNNYIIQDSHYLGNCTWNILTDTMSTLSSVVASPGDDVAPLQHYLSSTFQLTNNIPMILLNKYHGDPNYTKNCIKQVVSQFLAKQMSLVPILYSKTWESDLYEALDSKDPHPTLLLPLLFIIQWHWSCFSDEKLFLATKVVCLSCSSNNLRSLQVLLLSSYYFMGTSPFCLTSSSSYSSPTNSNQTFATELIHLSFSLVVNCGLFINTHRLIPISGSVENHTERLVTYWCFQFLDSWWNLIQGTPKYNFTYDEFQPPKLSSLMIPQLKSFTLLCDFVAGELDGCNLLHTLSQGGRAKLVYVVESFRQVLIKYKLYHQLQDHTEEIHSVKNLVTSLDRSHTTEIQLTLYYLILKLFSDSKSIQQTDQPSSSSLEETAYEILTLYYLVLVDTSTNPSTLVPQQLNILHLLPCNNSQIIELCLRTLHSWALSPQSDETDSQLDWQFKKYKTIVSTWCKVWYHDESHNPLCSDLMLAYKFNVDLPPSVTRSSQVGLTPIFNKLEYLDSMKLHNGRALLMRSGVVNPAPSMDPFDMFAGNSNGGAVGAMTPNTLGHTFSALFTGVQDQGQEDDDGYAEDDDEDDETPLEIPFKRRNAPMSSCDPSGLKVNNGMVSNGGAGSTSIRHSNMVTNSTTDSLIHHRHGSLFQHRNDKPIRNTEKRARSKPEMLITASDHIILENREPSEPPIKKPRNSDNKPDTSNRDQNQPQQQHPLHYSLVQGDKQTPPHIETPRSFVDMLVLSMPEKRDTDVGKGTGEKEEDSKSGMVMNDGKGN